MTRIIHCWQLKPLIIASLKKSPIKALLELTIPIVSLQRLQCCFCLKLNCLIFIHGLLQNNSDQRIQFCEDIHPWFIAEWLWPAYSVLWNLTKWRQEKKPQLQTIKLYLLFNIKSLNATKPAPSVTVWGGLCCDSIFGCFFFNGTLNDKQCHPSD